MPLIRSGTIALPSHVKPGGFDHAAVHSGRKLLYVAHTTNNALDVIDCASDRYLHSIPDLTEVAGALVSEERDLVFTSNRGGKTVGIFSPGDEGGLVKVGVGVRPNGLAYDPECNLLLAANAGDPAVPGSFTVSVVDVDKRKMIANVPMPGRTRWAIFDGRAGRFYVNIMEPAQIVVIEASNPTRVARVWGIPAVGPHGLDLDLRRRRLFCACDAKRLIVLEADSGSVLSQHDLSGVPDVVFFNPALNHLYVAIGDPGVIDVFDTAAMKLVETVPTERGAHTAAFDYRRNRFYALCPITHSAVIFDDGVEKEHAD